MTYKGAHGFDTPPEKGTRGTMETTDSFCFSPASASQPGIGIGGQFIYLMLFLAFAHPMHLD